jgi:hypothetical protein
MNQGVQARLGGSFEHVFLVFMLELQKQGRILCFDQVAHVIPVAIQHLLANLHPLVSIHQAFSNDLLPPHLEFEGCQLVVFEFLLLFHHQSCRF